jgi:hypothetical protein
MTFSWNSVTDIGVVAYIGIHRWFQSQHDVSSSVDGLNSLVGLGVSLLAGVWVASRMWEQFRARGVANKEDIATEKAEIKELQAFRYNVEKELIGRRAKIDEALALLQAKTVMLEKRMDICDSRERKSLRKLERLATRVDPWVKEFEPEGTRSIVSSFTQIDDEEGTGDGRG